MSDDAGPPADAGAATENAEAHVDPHAGAQGIAGIERRALLRGIAAVASGAWLAESCAGARSTATAAGAAPAGGTASGRIPLPGGLDVRGTRLFRDGKPFFINGINYWAALPLSRDGNDAGWDRLRRDLDGMQAIGINVIRTMGATEGPDSEPFRIVPALQPAAGQYDAAAVAGLARLVAELERRRMFAILVMNNFWHWSGGMAQYLAWAGKGRIPYPPPHPGGSWDAYQRHTATFYSNKQAKQTFDNLLRAIVPQLKSSPAVIWELANEPRGIDNQRAFVAWIDDTAALIRSLGPGQLVTTGSEGQTASAYYSGTDVVRDHGSRNIDFITFHLWAQNWGWIRKERIPEGYAKALARARDYVADHAKRAAKVGKPIVLEEFGFPRDGGSFDPDAPTTFRDKYFEAIYALVHELAATTPMAGIMPWAWAGEARPPRPGAFWKPGDPFTGDPPHEEQGWYSIYGKDTTVKIIEAYAPKASTGALAQ